VKGDTLKHTPVEYPVPSTSRNYSSVCFCTGISN
jgi:hypothetical protein